MDQGEQIHKELEKYYKGEDIFTEFIEEYKRQYKDKYVVIEVETPHKFKLGDHDFVVKKDLVVEEQVNIKVIEHKVTSNISMTYFDKYAFSSQIDAQTYSTQLKYGVKPEVIVNVIEIKELKRKPTADKYNFVKECDGGWLTFQFIRHPVSRTDEEIQQWIKDSIQWMRHIEWSKKNNNWIKASACMGGLNCAMCEHGTLCKMSNGTKFDEEIVKYNYKQVDPFEYLKEK
jgi:hypothetical protein